MQESVLKSPGVQVFCDFDGTITDRDSFDYLLEQLALPGWQEIEKRWQKDQISARECMSLQTALIPGPWTNVTSALQEVSFDPTFAGFAKWLRKSGIKLHIVSDGVDRVIRHLLQREGVQVDFVWSNRLVEDDHGNFTLEFPYASEDCLMGICKCGLLDRQSVNFRRVVIGDGKSDFCWAKPADLLFAKGKLLDFCRNEGITHTKFTDFDSIRNVLQTHLALTHAR